MKANKNMKANKKAAQGDWPPRCPFCGKAMTPGYLAGRRPLLWTPLPLKKTFLIGKEDVDLSQAFFSVAHICKDCKNVMIRAGTHKRRFFGEP